MGKTINFKKLSILIKKNPLHVIFTCFLYHIITWKVLKYNLNIGKPSKNVECDMFRGGGAQIEKT